MKSSKRSQKTEPADDWKNLTGGQMTLGPDDCPYGAGKPAKDSPAQAAAWALTRLISERLNRAHWRN